MACAPRAVDGLNGGDIQDNTLERPQGGRVMTCPGTSINYTVGHAINVSALQPGFTVRIYDPGTACQ